MHQIMRPQLLTGVCIFVASFSAVADDNDTTADWFLGDRENWPDTIQTQWDSLDAAGQTYLINRLDNKELPELGEYATRYKPSVNDVAMCDRLKIKQVVGPDTVIATYGVAMVWVEGINANTMTDDGLYSFEPPIWVQNVGAKTYTTVIGGSKTILHVRRIDNSAAQQALDAILDHYQLRFWTITIKEKNPQAGRKSTRGDGTVLYAPKFFTYTRPALARFVSATTKRIRLEAPDGTVKTFRTGLVSDSDRNWIKSHKRAQRSRD